MKHIISFLFILIVQYSFSQCGTVDTEFDIWMSEMQKFGGRPQGKPGSLNVRATIYIPIHYHIVRKSDGTDGYPLHYLMELHCDLNKNYSNSGIDIQFYIDTISYLNSTTLYDITTTSEENLLTKNNTQKHCNIYLVNSPQGNCGYTYRPSSFRTPSSRSAIFLAGSKGNTNCTLPGSTTLSHEMGHWLDLPHTFFGWENRVYGTASAPNVNSRERVVRIGASANCQNTGDGFCDTDPDYISSRWNCPNNVTYTDPLGATFKTDPSNFMCYTSDECMSKFSEEQKAQMYFAMQNFNERKDMLNLPIPDFQEVDTITSFSPRTNINTNVRVSLKDLRLTFNKDVNATHYVITISRGSTGIQTNFAFTPSNIIFDTMIRDSFLDLPASLFGTVDPNNFFYYWSVRAINPLSVCGDNMLRGQSFRVSSKVVSASTESVLCPGEENGKILISDATGGAGTQYIVNNIPYTVKEIINLPAGMYTIDVKYSPTEIIQVTTEVKEPSPLKGTSSVTASTATAKINPTGGTPPYRYEWSNGKTGQTQSNLAPGDYTVIIYDKNDCPSEEVNVKIIKITSGINSNGRNVMELFPTKITTGERIQLKNVDDNSRITITELNGKTLREFHLKQDFFTWDIETKGLFIINIISDKDNQQFKVESF